MTGKEINKLIEKILPVSSSVIGAPRRSLDVRQYLQYHPEYGTIEFKATTQTFLKKPIPELFHDNDFESSNDIFLAFLKNARIWGRNGAVVGDGDYFLKDIAREFNKGMNIDHSIFYTIRQKRFKIIKGNIALIGTAGANIYYHWMLDILPRLALIKEKMRTEDLDYFITEFTHLPFQLETLKKVAIPLSKIIPSNNNWAFHIKTSSLYLPSLAGPLGQPTSFQINYLKNLYADSTDVGTAFRKIYISRKATGRRQISNEEELISLLLRLDFEIIECEKLSVEQQVVVFSEAAIIICSHGSALTNLVFCKAGTMVIDIFNQTHINSCFWHISDYLGLNYLYFLGKSVPIDNNSKNDNTLIDIKDFTLFLNKNGLKVS